MNHTPGEWEVVISSDDRHRHIMSLFDGMQKNICALSVRSIEETEANARLIAAAPNLLDAAQIARNVLSDLYEGTLRVQNAGHELQAIVSHIEAAIAKATGKERS